MYIRLLCTPAENRMYDSRCFRTSELLLGGDHPRSVLEVRLFMKVQILERLAGRSLRCLCSSTVLKIEDSTLHNKKK